MGLPTRRGGSILELALVLGVMSTMTFGMVEFSYCFYCKNMLTSAAREGARAAIVSGATTTTVGTAVTNALVSTGWASNYYTVTITDTSGNTLNPATATTGTGIKVTVKATWSTLSPGYSPMKLITPSRQISGVCAMRKQP